MKKIINSLGTDEAILTVLLLALWAQMPHAQHVFAGVAHGDPMSWGILTQSWTYAVALEAVTLIFARRGKTWQSWFFAFISFLVNLAYYSQDGTITPTELLISAVLPSAIALYSHELSQAHSMKVPQFITQIPVLFSDVLNMVRFASTANEEPEPIPVQMPVPKQPEPATVESKPTKPKTKAAPVAEVNRFHNLSTADRRQKVKKLKDTHGSTNDELAEKFGVSSATISRDLNS